MERYSVRPPGGPADAMADSWRLTMARQERQSTVGFHSLEQPCGPSSIPPTGHMRLRITTVRLRLYGALVVRYEYSVSTRPVSLCSDAMMETQVGRNPAGDRAPCAVTFSQSS